MADWGYDDAVPQLGLNPAQPTLAQVPPQAVQLQQLPAMQQQPQQLQPPVQQLQAAQPPVRQQLQAMPVQQLQPVQPIPQGVQQVQGPDGSAPWTANPYHPEQNVENSPAEQQRYLDMIHGGQDMLKDAAIKLQAKQSPGLTAFAAMFGNRPSLMGMIARGMTANTTNARNQAAEQQRMAIEMLKLGHAGVQDGSINALMASQKAYTDQQNQYAKSLETGGKNDRADTRAASSIAVANTRAASAMDVQAIKQAMQQSGFQHDDAKVQQQFGNKLSLQNDQQAFLAQMKGVDAALQSDRISATNRQHLLTAKASIANNLATNNTNIEKHNADILSKYYKPNPKTGKSGFYNEKGEPVDPAIFMIDHQQAPQLDMPQPGQSAVAGSLASLQAQGGQAHPHQLAARVQSPAHGTVRVAHNQSFVPPPPATPTIMPGSVPPDYAPPASLGQLAKSAGLTSQQIKQKFVDYATRVKGYSLQQATQLADERF